MMQIYNTQTRRKEEFKPIEPGKVQHLLLRPDGLQLFPHRQRAPVHRVRHAAPLSGTSRATRSSYVQNFTDIDDKMIQPRQRRGHHRQGAGRPLHQGVLHRRGRAGHPSARRCNPRATEHIGDIIALIQKLDRQGAGLCLRQRRRVLSTREAFPGYGKLCGQNLEDLESGARIDVDDDQAPSDGFRRCGRRKSRASRRGNPRGAWAVRAGISSAPR